MRNVIIVILLLFVVCSTQAKDYTLVSPNNKIKATVSIDKSICLTIANNDYILLDKTPVDMMIDRRYLGSSPIVSKTSQQSIDRIIIPQVKIKTGKIPEKYNELIITLKDGCSLITRAYNEGVAYRFKSNFKNNVVVNDELLELNLPAETEGYLMREKSFFSMSESPYIHSKVADYEQNALFSLPCLFKAPNGNFLLVTESDIEDYPGMWFVKNNGKLRATLPQKALKTKTGTCTSEQSITERADYLAETKGTREYPWRIFIPTDTEKELIANQLVYLLGKPAPEGDYSWIKPGQATLDWWGRRNIFNTDFKGGVNFSTQKYFVDFNNKYGLKYFVLDDGWSDPCDLRKTNKEVDLNQLKQYAKDKNVSLVYWAHAWALKQDVAGYMDYFKSVGADGIKIDFFVRDDQDAVNLMHDIAREALKRKIVIDFHGICKPFGLNRTYPNVLTSEGLIEFEMNGVTDWANPVHHTMLPFIRMVAGPMDYLPGTFNNAQKREFHQNGNRPVGLGSRAHAIALAVLYESPITMIPDSPADYLVEDECTRFLTGIPAEWDEIKVIDGKIGEYVVIARRNGDNWYLGAITNWDKRSIRVSTDFLGEGSYTLEAISDGVNTETRAIDYKKGVSVATKATVINIDMAPAGGWVGKFTKK